MILEVELLAPVHQRHLAAEARQEIGLFHGRIAAAHHHDLLVPMEETVAGRARAYAAANQLVFRFEPSHRADAPDAMITVRVSIQSPSTLIRNGRAEKSVSTTVP